jgi:hypothetical protein
MMRTAAVLLLCLTACGPLARGNGEEGPERLTLCVRNETAAYGNIVARANLLRFDVMPGEEVCKPLPSTGTIPLRASTTAGGASGPLSYAAQLHTGGARCWRWRLTNSPASAADLTPCGGGDSDDTTASDSARDRD